MTSDDLVALLSDLNVDIRRSDGKEITGRCPVHLKVTGKEDRSPSWSMNSSTGLWLCFSCGARGTLSTLVSELTGDPDSVLNVQRYIIESSLHSIAAPKSRPEVPVDWVTYSRFSRVPDRLSALRNLNPDFVWKHGIRWDAEAKAWIIPIISPVGELRGWQAKKTGWFRNHPEGVRKSETLFGIDRFSNTTAVLVESPLDVVRLQGVTSDVQGLASFGAAVSDAQIKLLSMFADRLIIALDNDSAGLQAARRMHASLPYFRKGIYWFDYGKSTAKDIGDMTDEEILSGLDQVGILPPWAK